MMDSARYREQAEAVMRLAAKAVTPSERDVYLSIAAGWRKLAAEAEHAERGVAPEQRSFKPRE
jgi:hypothetical protein